MASAKRLKRALANAGKHIIGGARGRAMPSDNVSIRVKIGAFILKLLAVVEIYVIAWTFGIPANEIAWTWIESLMEKRDDIIAKIPRHLRPDDRR